MTDTLARSSQPEIAALDVYSQIVVSIAEQLTPRLSLPCKFPERRSDGSIASGVGRAVVITNDTASCSRMRMWLGGRRRVGLLSPMAPPFRSGSLAATLCRTWR